MTTRHRSQVGQLDLKTMSSINPAVIPLVADKGVNWFADIDRVDVPDWVNWLHAQAELGYANKVTARQAGFNITPADVELVPEFEEFVVVLLGYQGKEE